MQHPSLGSMTGGPTDKAEIYGCLGLEKDRLYTSALVLLRWLILCIQNEKNISS